MPTRVKDARWVDSRIVHLKYSSCSFKIFCVDFKDFKIFCVDFKDLKIFWEEFKIFLEDFKI